MKLIGLVGAQRGNYGSVGVHSGSVGIIWAHWSQLCVIWLHCKSVVLSIGQWGLIRAQWGSLGLSAA